MIWICPNCQSGLGAEEASFRECDSCGCQWDKKDRVTFRPESVDEDDGDFEAPEPDDYTPEENDEDYFIW